MSRVNKTRFLVQPEWHECKSKLKENTCSLKQKLNHCSCLCECKVSVQIGILEKWLHVKSYYV